MNYINTETLEYPVSEQDIRNVNPLLAFPSPFVAPENFSFVFPTPQPMCDHVLETIQEDVPVLTDKGHYEQTWKVVQLYTTTAKKNAAKADYLETQKTLKKDQVSNNRKSKELAGLLYAFSDSVGTIQTSDEDIRNVLVVTTTALILQSNNIVDPVIQFRDLENVIHLMTPVEAIAMGMAVQAFISSTYTESWALKAAIDSATTLLNLNKVII
jgi:hypothetical protein